MNEESTLLPFSSPEKISKDLDVFFNPIMKFNRDITLDVLKKMDVENIQVGLPLGGSGVRAARILTELPKKCIKAVHCNDRNPLAVKTMQEIVKLNNLDSRFHIHNLDAVEFLQSSKGFDYIDIDPFGSPNFLLDIALQRMSRKGILAVTATDTGALAGAFPNAGKMKYWAMNHNNSQKHEIGLRILARKVMLIGIQHSKALTPIVSYHDKHYYRIFFNVQKSRQAAGKLFDLLDYRFNHCNTCGNIGSENKCSYCNNKMQVSGPCYSGRLQELKIDSLQQLYEDDQVSRVGFFDTHEIAKLHKKSLIKVSEIIQQLENKGFTAVQSGFERTGIKTNASLTEILSCW